MKKLYKVEVIFETVVLAMSREAAIAEGAYIVKHNDDTDTEVYAEEIKTLSGLPAGWSGDCLPWGENPMQETIEQILS